MSLSEKIVRDTFIYESENFLMPFIVEERRENGDIHIFADIPNFGKIELYNERFARDVDGRRVKVCTRFNPYANGAIRWRQVIPVRMQVKIVSDIFAGDNKNFIEVNVDKLVAEFDARAQTSVDAGDVQ